MSRTTALKRLGQLTLAAFGMVLAAAPSARADTEMASQCFYLTPYTYSIRVVRIASDQTPGVQALFVRFRIGTSFQMLGTGTRANGLTPPQKDMVVNFMTIDGAAYRWTASLDPSTSTGPWTFYDSTGSAFINGTLLKVPCDSDAVFTETEESGSGGPGLPR